MNRGLGDLRGRVAVVTGAASGIGLALCESFAAQGMRLVMSDVDPDRLRAAADAVAVASGADVLAVPADVSRWSDVQALADGAFERFGVVHVLCNNAGVTRPGRAWELRLEDWEWVLAVNLRGVVNGIRAFVPRMLERGEPGHVVNTASVGGLVAFPGIAPYVAAKYAVVGLSETLHHDLRERGAPVAVSVLCPGPTATDFRAHSRDLQPGGALEPAASEPDVAKLPASTVAAQVVDAIRHGRFWILTHPAYREPIERRARGIVETDEVVVPELL